MLLASVASAALGFVPGRLVRGEPYVVGERRLTPVVRVREVRAFTGRVLIRSVEPVEVVDEAAGSTNTLVVPQAGFGVVVGAVAIGLPVLVYIIARLAVARRLSA
jgi:hypothetical protein